MDLPKEFLNRMKGMVPDYDKFIDSYKQNPIKSFFINNKKISNKMFLDTCCWDIEQKANGFKILEDIKVGKTIEHHSGMIYMQELSAMMPTTFLPLNEDDWVLDLCASPGGKSIQVANRIPKGLLVSNEIVKNRANILKSNIERMGLDNVCVINNEPKELEKCFAGIFDCVVVDAPCSGEGMFRKDEQAILNWSQENVEACAIRQKAVLSTADKMLKQNGYLLYSTCTFSLEENEQVVASFCKEYNYDIIKLSCDGAVDGVKVGDANTDYCLRFYPHKFEGEGQFVALLKKLNRTKEYLNGEIYLKPLNKFPSQCKLFEKFCKDNLNNYEDIISKSVINNNTIYYVVDKKVAESGVRLVNAGVVLGEIIKNRFEPNHNFATVYGKRFKQIQELSFADAEKYVKGETLSTSLGGWVVLTYKDVVLGLGKDSGVIKNHYPKGLRNI